VASGARVGGRVRLDVGLVEVLVEVPAEEPSSAPPPASRCFRGSMRVRWQAPVGDETCAASQPGL